MNTIDKPDWLKTKELHDAELTEILQDGRIVITRPRSRGVMYGPSESKVDQVGDGLIDVNHLMARYEKTGNLAELIAAGATLPDENGIIPGRYDDFSEAPDYEEALQITHRAEEQFKQLNAKIRNRFENKPSEFLRFINDPKNKDEAIKMGLRKPDPIKPEPDLTNRDVVNAIKETKKAPKPAGKGGESGE